jgi:phosphate starvation-inducible protein PhoH and related proteins
MKEKNMKFSLTPENNQRLLTLCGQHNEHLQTIEKYMNVAINNRGFEFIITGDKIATQKTRDLLKQLYNLTKKHENLDPREIHLMAHSIKEQDANEKHDDVSIHIAHGQIKPRGKNQRTYLQNILAHDVSFGVGPAGTGKTFLAVACAIEALEKDQVQRIILVRPAVEAGEKLGFLPGDLSQKVDPYLRPIYDALYEMMGFDKVSKLIGKNVIEVAPLAYMRGRTLNHAFIILDESQNTTTEQMKMFLTRLGFGSKVVITGDITQIDLAQNKQSGLLQVIDILKNVKDISFTFFGPKDVVRHRLVQSIVEAYEHKN